MAAGQRFVVRRMGVGELPRVLPIYEEAFPPEERKSATVLRGMLLDAGYAFYGAFGEGGSKLVGFAVVRVLEGTGAALLEYLAVDRRARGAGVGSALFQETARWAAAEGRVLLVEVESEDPPGQPGTAARRKAWYRRLGARELVGLRWRMPPVGGGVPPPMELMLTGALDGVSREALRSWIRAVYEQVYGRAGEAADGMLEGCGGSVAVI